VELLVQPGDRAALSRGPRLSLSLLADWRAAGQRRRHCAEPRLAFRDLHAPLDRHLRGGESGYTAPDPLHPDILFGGTVEKCNVFTGETKNVTPEKEQEGVPYRHAWTQPLVFSKADPRALYFANQFVYKTSDGGETWKQISADLTREDPGVPANLDAAAAADAPASKRRGVVYTLAPSPIRAPVIWAGTDDGLIHVTQDDGQTWQDVTPSEITPWTKVVMIEASHADANTAYAAAERHQLEDYEPHIYRTRDGGKSWQAITKGLPQGVYVQTVKEDAVKPGLLFCGTERGVFVSFDAGDRWQPLQMNLPPSSMRDLAIKDDDLIVATHGRGFWILDDITPLRQVEAATAAGGAFLFKPADAYLLPEPNEQGTPLPKDEPQAENAPWGAIVDFYLKSAPSGPVVLEIADASGTVVRRYASSDPPQPRDPNALAVQTIWAPPTQPLPATAGMHRWLWDFRGPPTAARQGPRAGAMVGPGTYTVKLTVDGKTLTQPLTLKRDPRSVF